MSVEVNEFESQAPRAVVFAMQKRHRETLESYGFTRRAFMNAATDGLSTLDDVQAIQDGQPVVLGTEHKETKMVYVAFQNPVIDPSGETKIRSKIVIIGSRVDGIAMPNSTKGYEMSDFELVEAMYDEAKKLQETVAPGYNIQQGIVRE